MPHPTRHAQQAHVYQTGLHGDGAGTHIGDPIVRVRSGSGYPFGRDVRDVGVAG